MFRKKQSEFQYAPGIEKIIEDIQGGGTIARAELKGIIDELPPLVIVGKDANGLYHVVKTGKVTAVAAADAVAIQIAKNHVFKVGEAVTIGGALTGASDVISAIDKTNAAIIAKTKRAEIENEMSKTSLFSLPFFSCIYWGLNNN